MLEPVSAESQQKGEVPRASRRERMSPDSRRCCSNLGPFCSPPPYPQQILWAFKQLPCRRIHLVSPPTPPPIGFHWTRPSDTSMEPMGPSPPARAEMTGPTDNTKVFCPSACQHGVWTSRQCCWRYLLWISQIQQLLQLVLEILRRKAAVNRVTHLKIVVNQCPNHKLLTLWALLWQNCLQFFMQIKLYN